LLALGIIAAEDFDSSANGHFGIRGVDNAEPLGRGTRLAVLRPTRIFG